MRRSLAVLIGLSLSGTLPAQPISQEAGSEVRVVPYFADHLVSVPVTPGYALLIELSPEERIENVILGDSSAWQVTPTKRGDRLVVKPLGGDVTTNLIVATTNRRYVFLLEPGGGARGPSVLRFEYLDTSSPAPVVPSTSAGYRFRGDRSLLPVEMSDDGARTTITWAPGVPMPAVFALDRKGKDTLVNGRMVGQSYVIEGTASRYQFRRDKDKATAIRSVPKVPSR